MIKSVGEKQYLSSEKLSHNKTGYTYGVAGGTLLQIDSVVLVNCTYVFVDVV